MANITKQAPEKYCIDSLNTSASGLLITKTGNEIDCTKAGSITGFNINYTQPSGTHIKFLFRTSDNANWFKLNTSGNAVNISVSSPDYDTVNQNGNSISELRALTAIPAFKGKKILIAAALSTEDISNAVPSVSLSLKALNSTQTLTHSEYSPFYELGNNGQIAEIRTSPKITGNAELKVYAQLTHDDGSLSGWLKSNEISGYKGSGIQLRADYSVSSLSGGTAELESADMIYSDRQSVIAGSGSGEIISKTYDWHMNVNHCRMTVKHVPLINSSLNAYVCFRTRPQSVRREQLGVGTGQKKTFQLANNTGVKYDSVKVYYDNSRVYGEYEVNTEVGRVTCNAPSGVIITCDYEYNWDNENWYAMNKEDLYSLDDCDVTEFTYSHPDTETIKTLCAVKLELTTQTGSITKESIGKGTGKLQTYKLSHNVKDGVIVIYANNTAMPKKSYYLTDDTQYVRAAAASGQALTASYDWISESPDVYQFTAVFAE